MSWKPSSSEQYGVEAGAAGGPWAGGRALRRCGMLDATRIAVKEIRAKPSATLSATDARLKLLSLFPIEKTASAELTSARPRIFSQKRQMASTSFDLSSGYGEVIVNCQLGGQEDEGQPGLILVFAKAVLVHQSF
jgi:hypothetical protein